MRAFLVVMYAVAASPVLVGAAHVLIGPGADVQLGAQLPPAVVADAVLDSQNRFYGMVFIGHGALLFLSLRDLVRYAMVFRLVLVFIGLGGAARVVSIAQTGLPTTLVIVLTAIELLGVPAVLFWHSHVLRTDSAARIR